MKITRLGWGLASAGLFALLCSAWLPFNEAMPLVGIGSLVLLAGTIMIRLAKEDEGA